MKKWVFAGAALCLLIAMGCASTSSGPLGTQADPAKLAAAKIVPPAMTRTIAGAKFDFAQVPAGSFQRDANRNNVSVITKGYYMMITEITQAQFQAVMGTNPSSPQSRTLADSAVRPVNNITWYTAIAFCNKLSLLDGKKPVYSVQGVSDWAGLSYNKIPLYKNNAWDAAKYDREADGYRLPVEAEWYWAAMGADITEQPNRADYKKAYSGSTAGPLSIDGIKDYAWTNEGSGGPFPVAKKIPNELGIYDMSGNAWEWCWDWALGIGTGSQAEEETPGVSKVTNNNPGTNTDWYGPDYGVVRIALGGGWWGDWDFNRNDWRCQVSAREAFTADYMNDQVGIRIVCNE